MKASDKSFRLLTAILGCLATWPETACARDPTATNNIRFEAIQGANVEMQAFGATKWTRISSTNQPPLQTGDRIRTGPASRVTLRLPDQSIATLDAWTEFEIRPPHGRDADSGLLRLLKGVLSYLHRGKPGRIQVITTGAWAGIVGTEFIVEVADTNGTERTTLSVVDGLVRFENDFGSLILTNHQQAIAEPDKAPVRTAGFIANNLLQWCFYYPAVLDLNDLPLRAEEQNALSESLAAYRSGDLLSALARYPTNRIAATETERIYRAALFLSVGQVEDCEADLAALPASGATNRTSRLADSLRTLIAAVKRQPGRSTFNPQLSTEFLAASYHEQSRGLPNVSLRNALAMARQATAKSPEFGFAWARAAELEFSFGRTDRAVEALERALALSPRNAQALALKGFLLAAQNKTGDAIEWFDRAIAVDSALGNAWLGRGLCRFRSGDAQGGRDDLLIAAALEPQRAALRSYLAKGWSETGDDELALKELDLAMALDPNDPTAWLYSALLKEQANRINEAIGDLEESKAMNTNRLVYRSHLLLDQDSAVRSANLARIYQEAGMDDVSLREAVRAVESDYANFSAHLFLANSYSALSDPNRVNLRYETPAQAEYLMANLLAPTAAGILSPAVTQQEYSRLFDRDRFQVSSATEYLSRGAWKQSASQSGTFGDTSYRLSVDYRTDPGQRFNNDFEALGTSFQLKQQLSPQDSIYLLAGRTEAKGGDLFQYFDPETQANPGLRTRELQAPFLALGWHHESQPGVHSLVLASYLKDRFQVSNPNWAGIQLNYSNNTPVLAQTFYASQDYENTVELYSLEAQQMFQREQHTTILGLLLQGADFETENLLELPFPNGSLFHDPAADQHAESDFHRISIYGYHRWQIMDQLKLVGGLSYDDLRFPENFRSAPVSSGSAAISQFSPKAGFIWTPARDTVLRAGWTRSLAGASLDQSLRLEPTEVAGFNQSFRSIAPETVIGSTAGTEFETFGVSLEHKFPTRTYVAVSAELLNSKTRQTIGAFALTNDFAEISSTQERIKFSEHSVNFTLDQLVGDYLSLGARYRLSQASLHDDLVDLSPDIATVSDYEVLPRYHPTATLQRLTLQAVANHPSGFWAGVFASWYDQQNSDVAAPGNDQFWQMDLLAGYRWSSPRSRVEVQIGVLNVTDQDYRLNPLNYHNELPRSRTFASQLRFSF